MVKNQRCMGLQACRLKKLEGFMVLSTSLSLKDQSILFTNFLSIAGCAAHACNSQRSIEDYWILSTAGRCLCKCCRIAIASKIVAS